MTAKGSGKFHASLAVMLPKNLKERLVAESVERDLSLGAVVRERLEASYTPAPSVEPDSVARLAARGVI